MPPKKKGSHKKTPPPKKGSTSETTQPDYPKEKTIEKEHENVCDLSQEEQMDKQGGKRKNDEASQGKIDKIIREPKMLKLSCGRPTSTKQRKEFHGSLDCVQNYGLRFVRNYVGEEETQTVEVILLYRSSKPNTTIKPSEFDGSVVNEGIKQDMADVCTVIFDKILKVENLEVAEDLKHLHKLMGDNACIKTISGVRWFIASHPSLWHWRSKLHFFGKVWNEYIQGQCKPKSLVLNSVSVTIDTAIRLVSCATDWQTRIPANTPFEKLIKHRNASVYRNRPMDLLCFVRDFLGHINDKDEFGKKMYIDEAVEGYYSNEQCVEKMIGDIFPLFLVEFYKELSQLNFFVW
ncbi:hypothetical protein LOK49_LG10G00425 [Camellia lanceoleosa]|uniref:Uncharacterized protein n=1 Tax=Camellia lanceoleosa TaxID=1840588 RepID=A0ACC0GCY0_9ERIC|nr:hypothetical protein LOK49_LG10G00425 [Camellia lanceoleosa]